MSDPYAGLDLLADVFPEIEPPEPGRRPEPVQRWVVIDGTHLMPAGEAAYVLRAYRDAGLEPHVAEYATADAGPELDLSLFRRPT